MISIIIPTLNEAANLPETLAHISGADEIIVADANSSDSTREIASNHSARVLTSPRGRALQLNTGAAAAKHDTLVFLHADTWLQPDALNSINTALQNPNIVGGAFHRRFRSDSTFLRLTCGLASIRNRAIGWHLGDQAIFCLRSIFNELGGFAPMRAFEDLDFSRRLARRGKIVTLNPPVLSSARRFERGPIRRTFADLALTLRYLLQPGAFRV